MTVAMMNAGICECVSPAGLGAGLHDFVTARPHNALGLVCMRSPGEPARGRDAGLTTGSRVDSREIRGLCFLYSR
jgi:hypothetical protein